MRSLTSLMETVFDDFYIIIVIEEDVLRDYTSEILLNEGQWHQSGDSDYWQRIDNPHFDFQLRHVHIAHKRHINSKGQQVSWNDDGTRHDKMSFNDNFTGLNKAKQIARQAQNLDDSIILENEQQEDGQILLESAGQISKDSDVIILKTRRETSLTRLLG